MIDKTALRQLRQTLSLYAITAAVACSALAASKTKQQFFPPQTAVRKATSSQGPVVVNAASFLPGVSPGGLATIFGTNLTDVTGTVTAGTDPFPTVLANVAVTVNGVTAAIFSISFVNGQDQISFQVPSETDTGKGAADIQVFDYGTRVAELLVDSYTEDPGIFAYQKYGQLYAVALHASDYALVTPDDPASRGEVILLYTTGLGPVDRFVRNGFGAPSDPPANTKEPFRVVIAGEDATLLFSGLAPGFVGLYQINMRLPGDLPAGDLQLKIFSDFADSQTVSLSVQ